MILVMFLDLKNSFFDRSVHGKRDNVILECSGDESVLDGFESDRSFQVALFSSATLMIQNFFVIFVIFSDIGDFFVILVIFLVLMIPLWFLFFVILIF